MVLEFDIDEDISWLYLGDDLSCLTDREDTDQTLAQVDCPCCDAAAWEGIKCPVCGGHGRVDLSDI